MKKILFLITMMLVCNLYSQDKCKVKKKYDEFEKQTTFTNTSHPLGRGLWCGFNFLLVKSIKENFESYSIFLSIRSEGCVSKSKSYVTLLFENGETKQFNYNGNVNCGTSLIYFIISKDDLVYISENKIKKVRICFDYNFDYEVKEKDNSIIINDINCILKAE